MEEDRTTYNNQPNGGDGGEDKDQHEAGEHAVTDGTAPSKKKQKQVHGILKRSGRKEKCVQRGGRPTSPCLSCVGETPLLSTCVCLREASEWRLLCFALCFVLLRG